jgi:hypothetical protein
MMRATTAIVVAGSLTAVTAQVTAAQAAPAAAHKRQVVKVVDRHPFGKMLSALKTGRSLYYMPTGTCRATCLTIWPAAVMTKGSTAIPTGVRCLGTAKFAHLRQLTYRGHRLYMFYTDTGSVVGGNGLGGFVVAKVKTGACPKSKK